MEPALEASMESVVEVKGYTSRGDTHPYRACKDSTASQYHALFEEIKIHIHTYIAHSRLCTPTNQISNNYG